jgi:opacity protein-like surface antigen
MNKTMKSILLACGLAMVAMAPAQAQGFEGGYAGIYAGMPVTAGPGWLGGVQGGYNFTFGGGALAGIEADLGVTNAGTVLGTAVGRVGFAFGSDAMVYGAAGAGTDGSITYYQLGAGAEFNVTDDVYLRGGVDRLKPFAGGAPVYLGKIGAGYRF